MTRRKGLGLAFVACACLLLALTSGCELLRKEAFTIVSCSPNGGILADFSSCIIQVDFSSAPDRASAENAFSLTEDGVALAGTVIWFEKSLRFVPHLPLSRNRDYALIVKADACDAHGVSLEEDFESRFTTKVETIRPGFLASVPSAGTSITGGFGTISLRFSEAISLLSATENLAIAPSTEGFWRYGASSDELVFVPLAQWKNGTEYEISINADLCDMAGNRLGEDARLRFMAGTDTLEPRILRVEAVDESSAAIRILAEDIVSDAIITENLSWEARWKIRIVFPEPVRLSTLSGKLLGEGCPALILKTSGESAGEAVFEFAERPEWDVRCKLTIREGVEDLQGNRSTESKQYRLRTNGPSSEPPRIMAIRMPLSPTSPVPPASIDRQLAVYTIADAWKHLPIDIGPLQYPTTATLGVPTFIEVYLILAAGASVDVYEVMKNFRVEATNGALSFQASTVTTSVFTVADPEPGFESYARVEIGGKLINKASSGLVTFVMASGFADSNGNTMAEAFRLPLDK